MKNAVMKDNVNSTSTDTEGELEGAAAVGVSSDEVQLKKFMKMLDMFDDNDDVQDVYHNCILPEEEDED